MTIAECKEQLQEDIIAHMDGYLPDCLGEELCEIVVRNFNKLEAKPDGS